MRCRAATAVSAMIVAQFGFEALAPLDVLGVDLGDHERHLGVEAEGARVVDDRYAALGGVGKELPGDVVVGGAEEEVEPLEGLGRGLDDLDFFTAELELAPGAPGRAEEAKLRDGEAPLLENDAHLFADGARGAENADLELLHDGLSSWKKCL